MDVVGDEDVVAESHMASGKISVVVPVRGFFSLGGWFGSSSLSSPLSDDGGLHLLGPWPLRLLPAEAMSLNVKLNEKLRAMAWTNVF